LSPELKLEKLSNFVMDKHEQLKNNVRQIFNSYKDPTEILEIYEIKGELIFGTSNEIDYKILACDPKGMIESAQVEHDWFIKLMRAIAYADLHGLNVPHAAREIDAKYKLDPNSKPLNKGGRPKDMSFTTCMRIAMLECIRAGFKPTKNEGWTTEIICAADIVYDILFELELAEDFADSTAIMRAWSREIRRFPLDKT
jgi:hypothetical protein